MVALIDGYETTLKKFYKERGRVRLQPANKNIEPIIIKKDRQLAIQGVVVGVIKNEEELRAEEIFSSDKVKRDSKLPLNKIILGDAVKELRKLPDDSCDVIIADPPYNIGKDFGNNTDSRELNEYIAWCQSWINECIRILNPNTCLLYTSPSPRDRTRSRMPSSA